MSSHHVGEAGGVDDSEVFHAPNPPAAPGLPVVLAEDVMVGNSHAARLSNWFAHFPALMDGKPPRTPLFQPWKRRVRYAVRDLRSAVGMSQRGIFRQRMVWARGAISRTFAERKSDSVTIDE